MKWPTKFWFNNKNIPLDSTFTAFQSFYVKSIFSYKKKKRIFERKVGDLPLHLKSQNVKIQS